MNASGSVTARTTITVNSAGSSGSLTTTTTACPGGTQGSAHARRTLSVSGGTAPYTVSVSTNPNYPPLAEGMSLNAPTGQISGAQIGGQGTCSLEFIVADSANTTATHQISVAINGDNAFLASIFPSNSNFHHRVDAATTGLPADTSPAAPIYSGYQSETIKPFFGSASNAPFPNGSPTLALARSRPMRQSKAPAILRANSGATSN